MLISGNIESSPEPRRVLVVEDESLTRLLIVEMLEGAGFEVHASPALFSITPALPAGLELDPFTGSVSGTMTSGRAATTYTVTAVTSPPVRLATATIVQTGTPRIQGQISEFPNGFLEDGAFQAVATRPGDGHSLVITWGSGLGGYADDTLVGFMLDDGGARIGGPYQILAAGQGVNDYAQPSVAYNPATGGWLACYVAPSSDGPQIMCQYLSASVAMVGAPFSVSGPINDDWNQSAIAFSAASQDFLVMSSGYSDGPIARMVDGAGAGPIDDTISFADASGGLLLQEGGLDVAYATSNGSFGVLARAKMQGEESAPWFWLVGPDGVPNGQPTRLVDDTATKMQNGSIAYDPVTDRFMAVSFIISNSSPLVARAFSPEDGSAGPEVHTAIPQTFISRNSQCPQDSWPCAARYRPDIAASDAASEFLVTAPLRKVTDVLKQEYYVLRVNGLGQASTPTYVAGTASEVAGNRPRLSFNSDTCAFISTHQVQSSTWGWQLFGTSIAAVESCGSPIPPTVSGVSPAIGSGAGGTTVTVSGTGFQAGATVTFGGSAATVTSLTATSITLITSAHSGGVVDVVVTNPNTGTDTAASAFTYEAVPNPPGPSPSDPPTAPRNVTAAPGIESAVVSWVAPVSTGSFPVTSYQVTASPGGRGCLVSAPALSCTITGLTPGESYTFVAKALNGGGWGSLSAPSNAVVPTAPAIKAILITSSRDRVSPSIVRVDGSTTGLVGAEVIPHVRKVGQRGFVPGSNVRTVDADGRFTWQRKSGKKFYVYFTSGDVRSNRLIITPRET